MTGFAGNALPTRTCDLARLGNRHGKDLYQFFAFAPGAEPQISYKPSTKIAAADAANKAKYAFTLNDDTDRQKPEGLKSSLPVHNGSVDFNVDHLHHAPRKYFIDPP